MSRAVVVFPGRGAYGPGSLHSLPAGHSWVRRADELRRDRGLPPLSEIDAADRFDPAVHLHPTNAWPLVVLCGLLDAERIADDHEVVAVVASSIGWYTALAASGCLGFEDALTLVHAMAAAAEGPLIGGSRAAEVIYPLTDELWQPDEERIDRVGAALDAADGKGFLAVDLGAFATFGGTAEGIEALSATLPPVNAGDRTFPLRLAAADAWHTPLRAEAAAAAASELDGLSWDQPNVTIVDGRGVRFTPWSTDPAELAAVSTSGQGGTTYDFAASLGVALREYAPDVVLMAGPGGSLGSACAQLVVMERYRGLRTRAEFEAAQAGPSPLLLSLRR